MSERKSQAVSHFRERALPEPGTPVGYSALIADYGLRVPLPPRLAAIATRHHPNSTAEWLLLTPRHAPENTLRGHLEFALKYEGVDLSVLNALFRTVDPGDLSAVVKATPKGIYARRIWFLYEWLTQKTLDVPEPGKVSAAYVVNPEQQFCLRKGQPSPRHRVINNLPGTPKFCPMIRRTDALRQFEDAHFDERARAVIGRTHPDVVSRAAAFLLLDDSRSSFNIEGEQPARDRAQRWGSAIAEAGKRRLSIAELERLQRMVIGDDRFVPLGVRQEEGFIGARDRRSGEPLPEHVSARPEDLEDLLGGVIAFDEITKAGEMDPVAAAAALAFGFVYIHPFVDGNGRIHRWLIHHALAAAGFSPPGIVFPISAVILRELDAYRRVLQSYSRGLLPFIDWVPTESGNVEVRNETADYYRYFDATSHAEFLYRCVGETIEKDLPAEVRFLEAYDRFAAGVQRIVDMPASTIELLHSFLRQNAGRLSRRAREREFAALTEEEVSRIERLFEESSLEELS